MIFRDLDFFSCCESCLLPFQVMCHIGYIPSGQRVVGLSKLSRVDDEVCSALHRGIKPAGFAVVLQCSHIHFPNSEPFFLDSNHQGWKTVLVRSGLGVLGMKMLMCWDDFLSLLKLGGVDVDKNHVKDPMEQYWCPCQSLSGATAIGTPNAGMVTAVARILRSLGEDPSRKELIGTPSRFVKWLMNFQNTNLDMKLNGFVCGIPIREVGNKEQILSEMNLSFCSLCEHLLPFYGVVHIAYFCGDGFNPIGRSLLQPIVHFYGFKLQVQERLSNQIAETVSSLLGEDVMVVAEAEHTCMVSRGIEKIGSSTATYAVLGRFATDSAARVAFLQSIPLYCRL